MLIGFSGFARVGKDSAASYLIGYERRAFADEVRAVLYEQNPNILIRQAVGDEVAHFYEPLKDLVDKRGWEDAKSEPAVRTALQHLGEIIRRRVDTFWLDAAFKGLRQRANYVFTDVRFPNEANRIRESGGHVIRIERPGFLPINNHISEIALTDYRYFAAVVQNDGTLDDLGKRITAVIDGLLAPEPFSPSGY